MIQYLLDTNTLGYFARQTHPSLQSRMRRALLQDSIAISVITRAETRFGLELLDPNDKRRQTIGLLLGEIPVLDWTQEAADCFGQIAALLHRSGKTMGQLDTMIAAHAVVADLTVVTHNTKHFERVPGLKLQDWTIPSS